MVVITGIPGSCPAFSLENRPVREAGPIVITGGVPGVTEQNRTILLKTLEIETVTERRQSRVWPKSLDSGHPTLEPRKTRNRRRFAGFRARGFWPGARSPSFVPLLLDAHNTL